MNDNVSPPTRLDRRRQRRRERRLFFSVASLLTLGVAVGLAVSLSLAWLVFPLGETTASPAVLRDDYKADYIYMVSESYALSGDWEQAQARLALLQDDNLAETVLTQVEDYLRRGEPAEAIRHLARLAERLGADGTALALFAPTPVGGEAVILPTLTPTPPVAASPTPTLLPTPTVSPPTSTPAVTRPPTAVPTTPTPPATFRLLSQQQLCQADLPAPRIEVTVVDAFLDEMPGVSVEVSWADGRDTFVTGFKPQNGPGYADFTMEEDQSYTVQIVGGGGAAGGLRVEPCADGSGTAGWILQFQNLELPSESDRESP